MRLAGKGAKLHLPRSARSKALAAIAAIALLVAGCSKGAYAVDLFPEMHYQQSTRMQEPPRLAPPESAVPVTGKEVAVDFADAANLTNPLPATRQVIDRGAEVFRVNCAMCHGPQAAGDGPVGNFLVASGYPRPPNLTAATTQNRSDGEIFALVTSGIVVMPQFKNMLNSDDRWALVQYLRSLAR